MGRSPCCDKLELKKGPWTPEEDQKLLAYIEEHGHGNWRALPIKAGLQRCGKSCRFRWTNYLRPDIKRGKFSLHEEQTIIQLHALLGNRLTDLKEEPVKDDTLLDEDKNVFISLVQAGMFGFLYGISSRLTESDLIAFREYLQSIRDSRGMSLMDLAAETGNSIIMGWLHLEMKLPFDYAIDGANGVTSLLIAAKRGNGEAAAFITRKSDCQTLQNMIEPETYLTPLHYAALHGDETLIRQLINSRVDVNAQSRYGTPAEYAALEGQYKIVRFLSQFGAVCRFGTKPDYIREAVHLHCKSEARKALARVDLAAASYYIIKAYTMNPNPLNESEFQDIILKLVGAVVDAS